MNTEGSARTDSGVLCVHARAELDRLLQDTRFHGTDRSRSILKFLAARHFDGQDASVKAYAIALDVLGRTSDFDPATDPIVRIEMSRLRSALAQYYEAFGSETGVTITLPKGNYVAVFSYTDGPVTEAPLDDTPQTILTEVPIRTEEPNAETEARPSAPPLTALGKTVNVWRLGVCVGLLGVGIASAGAWFVMQPDITQKPNVAVTISAAEVALEGEASLTRDMLMTALTQFRTLTVASVGRQSGSLSNSLRPSTAKSYSIDLKYYGDDDDRSVWWQIIDSQTGYLLKSGLERVDFDGKSAPAVRDELVSVLSRRFAATRGVINVIEANESPAKALGNACVLKAEHNLDDARIDQLEGAVECLERTIARESGNSDATAALSRVIMARTNGARDRAVTERALDLAGRAVSMTPLSDRAHIALMMVRFYGGRTASAIVAGKRALALNPNNPEAAAKLGMIMFASGQWQTGVSLANQASIAVDAPPRDALLVMALDAYRRGAWSSASLLSEQMTQGGLVVGMLRTAALGELGSPQAADALADLRSIAPDFEPRFDELMTALRYDPSLTASIAAGLAKAGARVARRMAANPS